MCMCIYTYAYAGTSVNTIHIVYHFKVSKCEKFGYGCMLTQVAATSPGMLALLNTGNLCYVHHITVTTLSVYATRCHGRICE